MVPTLDQSLQAVMAAIRMRGWEINITLQKEVYCVVARQTGHPSRTAAGPNLCSAVRALAEQLGLQADDIW